MQQYMPQQMQVPMMTPPTHQQNLNQMSFQRPEPQPYSAEGFFQPAAPQPSMAPGQQLGAFQQPGPQGRPHQPQVVQLTDDARPSMANKAQERTGGLMQNIGSYQNDVVQNQDYANN